MLAMVAVAAIMAPSARAQTVWQVNTTADNAASGSECLGVAGDCSLRQAIDKAASGDTIDVPAGNYVLTAGDLNIANSISIAGAGAGTVTIDAGGSSRVFFIQANAGLQLSGVTVTGGNAGSGDGGDIENQGTLTITDSTISSGGNAFAGGDIASETATAPTLTITNSTISGGSASQNAGGIYVGSGTATITGATVTGNQLTSPDGGRGAGLLNEGTMMINNSTISGNTSGFGGSGGGIADAGSDSTITNSTISGNSSGNGGGILGGGTNLTITNSTITGNTTSGSGGGIYDDEGGTTALTAINTTIAGNTATATNGANVFFNITAGGFQNTIIANPLGGGSNCDNSGDGNPTSAGNNLEDDAAAACGFTATTDLAGVGPKLGPLANNGGPTQTMALLAGSPAIDAGATVTGVTTDQRGGPRPQPAGGAPDIGAYEYGAVVDTALKLTGSPNPVTLGQTLTYTLTATNNGPAGDPAFGAQAVDTLPAGVTLQSVTPSQGSCTSSSTTVTCQLGTLVSGTPATVTITLIPTSIGNITNSGNVTSGASDPNPANNRTNVSTLVQNAPIAVTDPASGVSQTGAGLNGSVNPQDQSTTYFFQYGTSMSYGSQVPASAVLVGSDLTDHAVLRSLSGLVPNQTYHYRVVAKNATGTSFGGDQMFTTLKAQPVVITNPVSGISQTGATLNGSINPKDQATTYHFQYALTTAYGSSTPSAGAGSGTSLRAVLRILNGLSPGKTYHYRLVAQNSSGTTAGKDHTFSTFYVAFIRVKPSRIAAGKTIRVYGNAGGCPVGDTVTLLSTVFSDQHMYLGKGAIYTTVEAHGFFSAHTRIPQDRRAGSYKISLLCGRFPSGGAPDAAATGAASAAETGASAEAWAGGERHAVWSGRLSVS